MIEIFTSILDTFTTLVAFIINTLNSLRLLIVNIPSYVALVINSINLLPSFLIPFMLAFVSLVVVQYVLNRRA